jgi:drug/metabolite transporter (DMT)-like permease
MSYTGEIAALITAFLWSFTALFFTSASRIIGVYWLNKIRVLFAVILLGVTLLITTGQIFPNNAGGASYFYLIASGIIGLAIGDFFLFSGYVIIGIRLTLLIFSISPIMAAILAYFILGETLGATALIGIIMTIGGIAWVTAERNVDNSNVRTKGGSKLIGILCAIGGAIGQAVGLVLAKAGMADGITPLSATFVRMISAALALWMIGAIRGDLKEAAEKFRNRRAMLLALGGSICGPFLGVWMSLVSVKYASAGVAAAIMSIIPVIVIPLVIIFYKEKVSIRALLGAAIAVGGVVILFLR